MRVNRIRKKLDVCRWDLVKEEGFFLYLYLVIKDDKIFDKSHNKL